ncbi:MAG: FAD:protein FMN transferase [Halomonas sp.]
MLFALLMPVALVGGCRQPGEWQLLEGVALDTGYHITLNGVLQAAERDRLSAAIQGELASLESEFETLQRLLLAGWPMRDVAQRPPLAALEALLGAQQARAVDRLDGVLAVFGIEHAMIELGGVVRARGQAGRHPWRVALDRAWLDDLPTARLRLRDTALVMREQAGNAVDPGDGERVLAVSVVADTAEQADRRARELLLSGPSAANREQAIRLVVLIPQGLDIQHGSALEALLER